MNLNPCFPSVPKLPLLGHGAGAPNSPTRGARRWQRGPCPPLPLAQLEEVTTVCLLGASLFPAQPFGSFLIHHPRAQGAQGGRELQLAMGKHLLVQRDCT